MILLQWLTACCGSAPPIWADVDPVHLGAGSVTVDLADFVVDDRGDPTFEVQPDPDVLSQLDGSTVTFTPQPGWTGSTELVLTAIDGCDNRSTTTVLVDALVPTTTTQPLDACPVVLPYTPVGDPDRVMIAGDFNAWDPEATELEVDGAGFVATLSLAPGAYAYKFVEVTERAFDPELAWACDPAAAEMVCGPGTAPAGQPFTQDCTPGANSCDSLLIVPDCALPTVTLDSVDLDRSAGRVRASFTATEGLQGSAITLAVTLDGDPVDAPGGAVDEGGLSVGRHELRAVATDAAGRVSREVVVPFWTDEFDWDRAVLYFAFVDRMENGDPANDDPTGATGAEWEGGDWKGLQDLLPYLDDLGVSVLWISNPQDNAEGAWAGDCSLTYAGYHAYWPSNALSTESRFGDEAALAALIEAAHGRGMRVIMDWVGNHVHEEHPYATEHPEWFHGFEDCKANVNGQSNFDRIPEECWFAPYLPDVDYSNPQAMDTMLEDALTWAEAFGFDGFRVDAVKHMSHGAVRDLEARVSARLEHTAAGSDEDFWTVGETFDSAPRIAAYLGENGLDGQFDFPLYYSIRNVFGRGQGQVLDLLSAWDASKASFGDARMSTFLGNHDVNRFTTDAFEGVQGGCDDNGLRIAQPPSAAWPYESLRLGFSFLFTMPGVPLVYYGDELGIPGHNDPDNRQPLSWHVDDLGAVTSVDDLQGRVDAEALATARHVRALARARAEHPALSEGGWVEWWREPDVGAYARAAQGDFALVVLNRSGDPRTLDNGLAFAGLPEGTWEDVLTGDTFTSTGDRISVQIPARGSRVLVHR
jgi:glycosidase